MLNEDKSVLPAGSLMTFKGVLFYPIYLFLPCDPVVLEPSISRRKKKDILVHSFLFPFLHLDVTDRDRRA